MTVDEQLRTISAGGQSERYHYDSEGNLDCVTTGAGSQADCPAPYGGAPAASLLRDYAFDYRDRLEGYRSFAAGVEQDLLVLAYDALDRPVQQQERLGPGGPVKQRSLVYEGTSNAVVFEDERTGGGALIAERSYLIDSYGARLGITRTPAGGSAVGYTLAHTPRGSTSLLTARAAASRPPTATGPTATPTVRSRTATVRPATRSTPTATRVSASTRSRARSTWVRAASPPARRASCNATH